MTVKEIVKKDVICIKRSTSLRDLLKKFKDFYTFPLVPVVDDEGTILGVVYLNNLIELIRPPEMKFLKNMPFVDVDESAFDLESAEAMGELVLVDDIMEKNYIVLDEDTELVEAYKLMQLHKKDQLPVINKEKKLLGIVGDFSIIRAMFKIKGIY